jgi:hypothetical protein
MEGSLQGLERFETLNLKEELYLRRRNFEESEIVFDAE